MKSWTIWTNKGALARLRWVRVICLVGSLVGPLKAPAVSAEKKAPAPAVEEAWSRAYRDSYRLQESFSKRYPGTPAEALAAFRNDLSAANVPIPDGMEIDLRADKGVLYLQYDESVAPGKYQSIVNFLARAGLWDVRQRVTETAIKMARIRLQENILDEDPDNADAVLKFVREDRPRPSVEETVSELRQKISTMEKGMARLKSTNLEEWIKATSELELSDPAFDKLVTSLREASLQMRIVAAEKGVDENHPRLKEARAREEAIAKIAKESLAQIAKAQEASLQGTKRILQDFEKQLRNDVPIYRMKLEQRMSTYREAKARYLQARSAAEAAGIKFPLK